MSHIYSAANDISVNFFFNELRIIGFFLNCSNSSSPALLQKEEGATSAKFQLLTLIDREFKEAS